LARADGRDAATEREEVVKIIRLTASNFKKLRAVEITPTGNLVQVTGRNGAGKTSILDAIWVTLAGASAIQPVPIRLGEESARIQLDLGELVVTRTFKRVGDGEFTTAITVANAEGARFPSPQRMLDELLGALSFDPLAFARMGPKEQFNELRRFVPGVDFEEIEKQNALDYSKRTDINRRAKEARAQAAGITLAPVAAEPEDEWALVDELQRAMEHNAAVDAHVAALESHVLTISRLYDEARGLREQAERLEARAKQLEAVPPEPLAPRVDVSSIRARIDQAHALDADRAKRAERKRLEALANELEEIGEGLTLAMQLREEAKRDAVAAAQMPVPDITFGDGVILKAGVPFDQASDAEKLRASVAIAMAGNPKLKVLRIRDGSLLDSDSLRLIAEMAQERQFQVWVERVADDGKVGFVIEDGQVKESAS